MVCTFIGHRDAPWMLKEKLESVITELIVDRKVDTFYIGNHGAFDKIALYVIKRLKTKYPHINYYTVVAYLPQNTEVSNGNTLFPQGLELVHPRNAINVRNKWMIENSDFLVSYVIYNFGGAAKIKRLAEKNGKIVINLL